MSAYVSQEYVNAYNSDTSSHLSMMTPILTEMKLVQMSIRGEIFFYKQKDGTITAWWVEFPLVFFIYYSKGMMNKYDIGK